MTSIGGVVKLKNAYLTNGKEKYPVCSMEMSKTSFSQSSVWDLYLGLNISSRKAKSLRGGRLILDLNGELETIINNKKNIVFIKTKMTVIDIQSLNKGNIIVRGESHDLLLSPKEIIVKEKVQFT